MNEQYQNQKKNENTVIYEVPFRTEYFSIFMDLNNFRFRCEKAPEPDQINWENFEYTTCYLVSLRAGLLLINMVILCGFVFSIYKLIDVFPEISAHAISAIIFSGITIINFFVSKSIEFEKRKSKSAEFRSSFYK